MASITRMAKYGCTIVPCVDDGGVDVEGCCRLSRAWVAADDTFEASRSKRLSSDRDILDTTQENMIRKNELFGERRCRVVRPSLLDVSCTCHSLEFGEPRACRLSWTCGGDIPFQGAGRGRWYHLHVDHVHPNPNTCFPPQSHGTFNQLALSLDLEWLLMICLARD